MQLRILRAASTLGSRARSATPKTDNAPPDARPLLPLVTDMGRPTGLWDDPVSLRQVQRFPVKRHGGGDLQSGAS
eukprot:3653646-Pyramimonas_sp.AAC.1